MKTALALTGATITHRRCADDPFGFIQGRIENVAAGVPDPGSACDQRPPEGR